MARVDVREVGTSPGSKEEELKKDLWRTVGEIVGDGACIAERLDEAIDILCSLKDLKFKPSKSANIEESTGLPAEFLCPLSRKLMADPVIIDTGHTYERCSIEAWLKSGHGTCPRTRQRLSHNILTPNHSIRELIEKWRPAQKFSPSPGLKTQHFSTLIRDISSSSSTFTEKKEAAKTLRSLTKKFSSFRVLFGETVGSIDALTTGVDHELQEDVVTTLLNISIPDINKKIVGETPTAIPFLVDALTSGTIETRRNSAAALFTLSALDSNKEIIGRGGAIKHLIRLLDEGHAVAGKDSAAAIFSLCILHENKARAVKEGAIAVMLRKIKHGVLVDELLTITAMLSSHHRAIEELGELGGVSCLLGIMRETDCDRKRENCVAVLHAVCFSDRTKLKELKEEISYRTIMEISQNGTARAKRKATDILSRLNRAIHISHTA